MKWWLKDSPAVETVTVSNNAITAMTTVPKEKQEEEWIEVEGYKALNSDMTAYEGFQYEIGKTYVADGEIKVCHNGFHFCLNLADLRCYKDWRDRYRLFRVKALVRKSDYESYGEVCYSGPFFITKKRDKLAAKEITLLEELPFIDLVDFNNTLLSEQDVKEFYTSEIDYYSFIRVKFITLLQNHGYSETFSNIIFDETYSSDKSTEVNDTALNRIAKRAVALMDEGVSADMRAYLLLK